MPTTVGIDVGGSSITSVARDETSRIIARHHLAGRFVGARQVLAGVVESFHALGDVECAAVGIGIPGQVEAATGQVRLAVNLGIGVEPLELVSEIESRIGVPVVVENDVRAAAIGAHESLVLAGEPPASLVVVSLGTGISAGVVIDGVLIRGWHGMAGEIGHVVVDPLGPVCPCGQRGCLETFASGPAIGRAWPRTPAEPAANALFSAVAAGDPAAATVANRIVAHLTTALIWLAAAFDTELVMIAGGVATAGEPLLAVIRDHVALRGAASELAARRLRPEQVVLTDPQDPPGPRGAALLAAGHSLQARVSPAGKQAST